MKREGTISSTTNGQQAYLDIRQRILSGDWLPGAKLTLRVLAEELGTSVQPVREAVQRLTAERALILRPNSSILVPPVEARALKELWNLRGLLEGEAARLCIPHLTDSDFAKLDAATMATQHHHLGGGERRQRVWAIQTIALIIADKSGSTYLTESIYNLRVRSAPYLAAAMESKKPDEPGFMTFAIRLQHEFIDALKRRDADNAMHLRRADIYTFYQHILRRLDHAAD